MAEQQYSVGPLAATEKEVEYFHVLLHELETGIRIFPLTFCKFALFIYCIKSYFFDRVNFRMF